MKPKKPGSGPIKSSEAGPEIRCARSKDVDPRELKPNPRNPNKHGADQLRVYAKILHHQGWRKPIVVSKQSGFIVTGEGAFQTAMREGWTAVPVDYQDFKSPEDELAHLVADNRLPQLAECNDEELAEILGKDLSELDLEITGALFEEPEETELKSLEVKPPPKMAWVLIGIPLVRFSEVSSEVEKIAGIDGTTIHSTVADK